MTAKQFLKQYINIEKAINDKVVKLSQLRASIYNTSMNFKNDRVQTSQSDRLGYTVAKIVDLERKIDKDIDKKNQIEKEIKKAINSVDDFTLQVLLRCRYLCGLDWEKTAKIIDMNFNSTRGWLHAKALKKITQYLASGVDIEHKMLYNANVV